MKLRIITTSIAIFLSTAIAATAFAQQRDAMKACVADVKALCAGVERGEGRIAKCLKENESKLSAECKEKLKAAGSARSKGGRGGRNSGGTESSSN
jgi:Cysteine rich repeat